MIITTSFNPNQKILKRVNEFIVSLNCIFIDRDKKSLVQIMQDCNTDELIVIEKKHAKYYKKDNMKSPFFFHPSMAALRINRLKQGDNDLMIKISELKYGDSFLDCTLGLASDAIVASFVVGNEGRVVGLESEGVLATIVKDGLNTSYYKNNDLNEAMRRIEVINANHIDRLKLISDNSFDIVYLDPMFRLGVNKSSPINSLRTIANYDSLLKETITEARRIAKRKVILKEVTTSKEFKRLGFSKIVRSSSTTYGVISIGEVCYEG